jgi:hypothetical protein
MTNVHVRRPLQINLHALLQQSNPTIDLGVQSYESTTRNFLKAVTNYKNRAMAAIDERRKHQVQEKKKVLDRITVVENETAQCKLKEIELVARMLPCSKKIILEFKSDPQSWNERKKKGKTLSSRLLRLNGN